MKQNAKQNHTNNVFNVSYRVYHVSTANATWLHANDLLPWKNQFMTAVLIKSFRIPMKYYSLSE